MKNCIFQKNYLKVDLFQTSNSEKSLVLACCVTYTSKQIKVPSTEDRPEERNHQSNICLLNGEIIHPKTNSHNRNPTACNRH